MKRKMSPVADRPGLRWGIAGTGWIVPFMVDAMRAVPGHEVRSVLSASPDRAQRTATVFGIPVALSSLADLAGDPEIDAVYVASRNDRHRDQVIACAEAGKHVLCDKPLGLSGDDCADMLAAAERGGVVLAVNHHLRSLPAVRAIREAVGAGRVGKPRDARVSFAGSLPDELRTWRLRGPGAGVELDLTVHSVDVLRFVLDDDVEAVMAMGASRGLAASGVADDVMSVLRFARGTLASVHDSFTLPGATTSLEIHGSEGSVLGHGVIGQSAAGVVELRCGGRVERIDAGPDVDPYADTVAAFTAAVRGEGAPRCSGEDGAEAVRIALAVAGAARAAGGLDPRIDARAGMVDAPKGA